MKNLPRVLLVSEVTLSKDGRGASQTLFNLLKDYPAEHLMLLAPKDYLNSVPPSTLFARQCYSFTDHHLPLLPRPFGKLINPLLKTINLQLLDWLPVASLKKLEAFAPEIILVCPITISCLVMGQKLTKHFKCPFVTYFMDDWLPTAPRQWLSGSVKESAYQLLKVSKGWLMISEQLQKTLSKRYQLTPEQSIVVHNPVDLSDKEPPRLENYREGTFKIVYAGSIWPMHYDALAVIAEAVFQLRISGKDLELIVYTTPSFWDWYKDKLQTWEVTYGGLIPYNKLNFYLKQSDLLLVASSFLPEYSSMTSSSVQTKITDYMASGRPILACGPTYSACNHFIKNWECGIVCETNNLTEIKKVLVEQMENWQGNQKLAHQAYEILKNNFEHSKVRNKLYNFFQNIIKK